MDRQNLRAKALSHSIFGVVQCSAKRLAPHLAEFFQWTFGRSLAFLNATNSKDRPNAFKILLGKELGTENHNNK